MKKQTLCEKLIERHLPGLVWLGLCLALLVTSFWHNPMHIWTAMLLAIPAIASITDDKELRHE